MQAIILAGGLGTRLKSVVADKPKVLSPVAGNPFLKYIIDYLLQQKITNFIFSLGYLHEQVLEFLQTTYPALTYTYTVETSPLGTGGGIKKAMELVTEENVFVVNADTFFGVDLPAMMQFHKAAKAHCTVSLKAMNDFDRYGTVEINEHHSITSFKEKQFTHQGLINGGYLIFNKACFMQQTAELPEVFAYEKDFLEKYLLDITIKGYVATGYFIDIGIPEDFAKAQLIFDGSTSTFIK
ncbi:MAG: nucleotidyltransferase family protein [Chitinophagaceae bacterium]|jgi:D-glycero-alpha-D-manno-heptose 1-phosphate guanylyltransferase|nr:nucleotidyltransferase family protein [Chitinophagaceae bacterium]